MFFTEILELFEEKIFARTSGWLLLPLLIDYSWGNLNLLQKSHGLVTKFLLLLLSEFKQINYVLFPLKS